MTEDTCIYTKTKFSHATYEHILQNSLGARWESNQIICDAMQAKFGGDIDVAVAERVSELRSLFATRGGRRDAPPRIKGLTGPSGTKYNLDPGGKPTLAEPTYEIQNNPDGTAAVRVDLSDPMQFEWAKWKVKNERPELDLSEMTLESGESREDYINEPVQIRLSLGGTHFFRGILKSVFNMLGACAPEIALRPHFDPLRQFVVEGIGESEGFARFIPHGEKLPVPTLGPIDHLISVWSKDGEVRGIAQLFGDIPYALRLAEAVECDDFHFTYVVNPRRDSNPSESKELAFDASALPDFYECAVEPGPSIWTASTIRISRIMERYLVISALEQVKEILKSMFGDDEEAVPTAEQLEEFIQRLPPYIRELVRDSLG